MFTVSLNSDYILFIIFKTVHENVYFISAKARPSLVLPKLLKIILINWCAYLSGKILCVNVVR